MKSTVVSSPLFEMQSGNYKKNDDDSEKSNPHATCEEVKKSIVFDAIAVHFHTAIFFQQLLSHICLPLYPYLTKNYWVGEGFWTFAFNFIFPMLVYLMIFSAIACGKNDRAIIDGAMWIPLIFYFQHRVTIAIKYASLSATEYCRFMNCTNRHQSQIYQLQMQLFTGWMLLDDNVLYYELSAASARIGANIAHFHLIIK